MADEFRFDYRDRESALDFLAGVLEMSRASQTEVSLEAGRESLTRFAGNQIHQNVSESDHKLTIRSIEDGCIGYASTNSLARGPLRESLEWARAVARSGRIKAEPAEFAGPQEYASIDNYSTATAEFSPVERAETVGKLIEKCSSKGAEAAGAVSNSESALAIANTNGLRAYNAGTDSNFTATVSADGSTGWCDAYAVDAPSLKTDAMGKRALERAVAGRNPRKLEPGRYTVILEEAPIKDFLDYLNWLGFGAQAFEEGRSYMCDKVGEKITGDNITIIDDAYHLLGAGVPFDFEGMPRQRVVFIEDGVAREVVYDRAYGARAGRASTGHALPARFTYGPLPLNLIMKPGETDYDEMLRSVERGLLISRFWYCRVVDPAKTLMTGQTRDGTFLIENGKIVCGVQDMRFNENILEAFSRAETISKSVRRIGTSIVPAMKIADFRFTETVGEH